MLAAYRIGFTKWSVGQRWRQEKPQSDPHAERRIGLDGPLAHLMMFAGHARVPGSIAAYHMNQILTQF